MRAAVIEQVGEPPSAGEAPDPTRGEGEALIEVSAEPINPIDVAIGAGKFYSGPPEVPYVPGKEGFGRVIEADGHEPGTRVYFETPGGLGGNGSFGERAAVAEEELVAVEQDIDDALAASLGIPGLAAWLSLEWRAKLAEGETVLVLGASGAVGIIAVQAAKLMGAGRVVAAARDGAALERVRERGADATVDLSADGDLTEAFKEAAGGGIDVIVDPLWGPPAVAALQAMNPDGRLVHLGQSASPEATIPSGPLRGNTLTILGHTSLTASRETKSAAYLKLVEHAAAGRIVLDTETFALDEVTDAWQRQSSFPYRKLVLSL